MRESRKKRYQLISLLMQFPDTALLAGIPELDACAAQLDGSDGEKKIAEFLDYLKSQPLIRLQETYTAAFDMNPSTTLNMTYHLLGDGEKRAGMMALLRQLYFDAGYDCAPDELPDFLPLMLEFTAVCPEGTHMDLIDACLAEIGPLAARLRDTASPYSALLASLADESHKTGGTVDRSSEVSIAPQ